MTPEEEKTAAPPQRSAWPWALPLGVVLCGALFVAARLAGRDWDPSVCVCASTTYCEAAQLPAPLRLHTAGVAYDGLFFYRLALAPWDWRAEARGIRFDNTAYRVQRIGYPLVCWLTSGGRAAWLAGAMLAVNLFWLGVLAWVLVRWLRALNFSAVWALLPCLWPGLLVTLGRDLCEIQEATLLVLGCWLLFRDRAGWGALALTGAVLTRETALLPVAGLFVFSLWQACRQPQRTSWSWPGWLLLPLGCALLWQVGLRLHFGVWPMRAIDTGAVASPVPGLGLLTFLVHGLPFRPLQAPPALLGLEAQTVQGGYWLFSAGALGLLLLVLVAALLAWRSSVMSAAFKWAALAAFGAVLIQTESNWQLGPSAFLRIANEACVLGLLLVATAPQRLRSVLLVVMLLGWLVCWPYALWMP